MDQRGSRWIKGDQCDLWIEVRGVGVGGFSSRSKQIKMDQRGSRWIKGDQHDLWVGVRVVGVSGDQDRSKRIKADQRGSLGSGLV